ncbi:MAG: hypothetical protein PHN69_02465 [Candidatus Pacebacteria bacterium]|nr:hypothetical protein [Candidatus Paceibacterota bacterium]
MNELYDKYPKYKNIKGIELQRWKICPVDVQSDHNDIGIAITGTLAKKLSKEIEHTPLYYGDSNSKLPMNHGKEIGETELSERTVIGTGLDGGVITEEDGTQWLYGDYAIFTDTNKDIIENIKQFKDDVSASYELSNILYDDNGKTEVATFKGNAVLDKDYSAYHHKALLVAAKSNVKETDMDKEAKDLLQKIYDVLTVSTKIAVNEAAKDIEEEIKENEESIKYVKEDIKWSEESMKEQEKQAVPVIENNWQEDNIKRAEERIKEKEDEIENLKIEMEKLRETIAGFVSL